MTRAEYQRYLETPAWQTRRAAALERAEHACQVCNAGGELHVHHRTYDRVGDERPMDLTVLCEPCHALFHDKLTRRQRAALAPFGEDEERNEAAASLERLARTPAE